MLTKRLNVLVLFVLMATLAWWIGCSSDGGSPTDSNGDDDDNGDIINQDSINQALARDLVDSANDSLGSLLHELINETIDNADSSFRPHDMDFSGVNSLYEEALMCWSANMDARFGVAFTNLMLFCGDPDLNQLIDDFKTYHDTMSFNPMAKIMFLPEVSLGSSQKIFPDGIPATPGGVLEIMPAVTKLDQMVISSATAVPTIGDIQANLEDNLLPRILAAEECLTDLMADPEYTFTVTPSMQGNLGAAPIILDQSDFSLFLGVAYAAEAALHIFFSRNLDVTAYNAEAVEDAVNQDSDFLTLKGSGVGQGHMTTAKSRLLSAEAQLEATVDYLLAEIGTDQTYDLISVYADDEYDLLDIKDSLIHYRSYMDEIKEYSVIYNKHTYCIWNGYYLECFGTEDTLTLDVDLKQFFDNPMVDPKDFLPGYTITLEAQDDRYKAYAAEHFSRAQYWTTINDLYGLEYPYDTSAAVYPYFTNHLPDEDSDEFYRLLADSEYGGYGYRQFVFGWDDMFCYYSEPCTDPYEYGSNNMWTYKYYYSYEPDKLWACYEWTANSYEEWEFPDPTFNGLLPNMTSAEIKDIILDDPADWEKSGCDYLDLRIDW